jgi:hypothetical protein
MGPSRLTGPALSVIAMMALAGCGGEAERGADQLPAGDRITAGTDGPSTSCSW